MDLDKIYEKLLSDNYKKLFDLITFGSMAYVKIICIIKTKEDKNYRICTIKNYLEPNMAFDGTYRLIIGSTGVEYGKYFYDSFEDFEKDCKRLNLKFIDVFELEGVKND